MSTRNATTTSSGGKVAGDRRCGAGHSTGTRLDQLRAGRTMTARHLRDVVSCQAPRDSLVVVGHGRRDCPTHHPAERSRSVRLRLSPTRTASTPSSYRFQVGSGGSTVITSTQLCRLLHMLRRLARTAWARDVAARPLMSASARRCCTAVGCCARSACHRDLLAGH